MLHHSPARSGLDRWLEDPSASWRDWRVMCSPHAQSLDGTALPLALQRVGRAVAPLVDRWHGFDDLTGLQRHLHEAIGRTRPRGILVDLPDLGLRCTPESAGLTALLRAASATGVPITILDRPNPLDGVSLEGPLVHPGFETPQACTGVPLRHGLTVGEHAQYRVREERLSVDLKIVRCQGWSRDMDHTEHGIPLAAEPHPSPWVHAVRVVPGGTDWATAAHAEALEFGGPWAELESLLELVEKGAADADTQGAQFAHTQFTPETGAHAGKQCTGVRVTAETPRSLHTLKVGLVLAEAAARVHALTQCPPPFPAAGTTHLLDRLLGSPEGRVGLAARVRSQELLAAWEPDLTGFADDRRAALLY